MSNRADAMAKKSMGMTIKEITDAGFASDDRIAWAVASSIHDAATWLNDYDNLLQREVESLQREIDAEQEPTGSLPGATITLALRNERAKSLGHLLGIAKEVFQPEK